MTLHDELVSLLVMPAARAASDTDLHCAVTRLLDMLPARAPVLCPECKDAEAGYWRRHAEILLGDDAATRTAPAEQLRRSLTQLVEDQAHAIDVFAELAAAGDIDGIRMHYEHHKGVTRG